MQNIFIAEVVPVLGVTQGNHPDCFPNVSLSVPPMSRRDAPPFLMPGSVHRTGALKIDDSQKGLIS